MDFTGNHLEQRKSAMKMEITLAEAVEIINQIQNRPAVYGSGSQSSG